jgi:hypothetical protein
MGIKIGTEITLTEERQELSRQVALERYENNRRHGTVQAEIHNMGDGAAELEGCAGEIAFCQLFGTEPDLSIYTRSAENGTDTSDTTLPCGLTVDIKTTKHMNGRLITPIHKNITGDLFALMTGKFPNYIFRGFMSQEKLIDDGNIGDLGYGPTYIANQAELKDLKDVRNTGETIS